MRVLMVFFESLIKQERCAHKFALSCCTGVYIAFSPFVGFHTIMVFLFSWLFALNAAIMFSVSLFINNPWTMVPVYGIDYIVGDWLFNLLGINGVSWNPWWCYTLLTTYSSYSGLSLGAFLVGGNLLGLSIGGIVYPIMRYVFSYCKAVKS